MAVAAAPELLLVDVRELLMPILPDIVDAVKDVASCWILHIGVRRHEHNDIPVGVVAVANLLSLVEAFLQQLQCLAEAATISELQIQLSMVQDLDLAALSNTLTTLGHSDSRQVGCHCGQPMERMQCVLHAAQDCNWMPWTRFAEAASTSLEEIKELSCWHAADPIRPHDMPVTAGNIAADKKAAYCRTVLLNTWLLCSEASSNWQQLRAMQPAVAEILQSATQPLSLQAYDDLRMTVNDAKALINMRTCFQDMHPQSMLPMSNIEQLEASVLRRLHGAMKALRQEERFDKVETKAASGTTLNDAVAATSGFKHDGSQRTPDAYNCPITCSVMDDPVLLVDAAGSHGFAHTYERHAIETWLRSHSKDPLTGMSFKKPLLESNYSLRKAITAWQEDNCLRMAEQQMMQYAYHEAEKLLTNWLAKDPSNAAALTKRGTCKYKRGEFQGAIDDLTKAIELNHNDVTARILRGQARIPAFRKTMEQVNASDGAQHRWAWLLPVSWQRKRELKVMNEAVRDLKLALEMISFDNRDERANVHVLCAKVYRACNKKSNAIEEYRAALRLRPKDEDILTRLGATLAELGGENALHEASECLKKALRIDPSNLAPKLWLTAVEKRQKYYGRLAAIVVFAPLSCQSH